MASEEKPFDLAIVGGGIAGAAIARDAALRGLRVALFEKSKFGSGTSSKSSRLIHGGVRYLETAWQCLKKFDFSGFFKNFRFVMASLRECSTLAHIAPQLVRPLALIIPVYRGDAEQPWTIYFGSLFYGLLGLFTGNPRLPKIFWTQKSVLKHLPNLNPKNLLGGVMIWDHWTDDLELVRATIRHARKLGVKASEKSYVKHCHWNQENNLYQIIVQHENEEHCYEAKKVVNATGPWVNHFRKNCGDEKTDCIVPIAGAHLMLPQFTQHSVILRAPDDRLFFVINLGSLARIGTTERFCDDPDHVQAEDEEIEYLLTALERYFPNHPFQSKDIISTDAGIRPLVKPLHDTDANAISREHEIREAENGIIHVLGVKLTDHRRAAEEVVNYLVYLLKPEISSLKTRSQTHRIPLPK